MKELLKRWSNLQPDICQVISPSSDDGYKIKILPDRSGWHWIEFTEGNFALRSIAVVQLAVQQAIVARGWYFDIAYLLGSRTYYADLVYQTATANNPAEALLSAYVQALEAIKEPQA